MKWGIYARNCFEGSEAFRLGALESGCFAWLRSVSDYSSGDIEDFDAVVVFGLQGRGPDVLRDYRAIGVPVFVIDYGYMKRTNHAHDWRTGHWQVSLNGLNVLPDWDCDASRFKTLGVEIVERGGKPDGYVLLCVQTTGDASHGMGEKELKAWADAQNQKWPGLLIRPHPLQDHLTYGLPVCPEKTLEEALAGARLVVTGNSNSGHDALISGVPVVATVPGAAWDYLSSETLPSKEQRLKHFHRCAWGQWTWAEFRTGEMHRCLMQNVLS